MEGKKFIPLSACPEVNSSELLDSDFLLASVKNENNQSEFRKLNIGEFKDYLRVNYMQKLGLDRTFSPYLFQVYFDDYSYQYGIDRLEVYRNINSTLVDAPIEYSSAYPNGCTALHLGSLCGHNYDCKFDDLATFIVRTPLKIVLNENNIIINRHATLSISSRIRGLTKDFINSKNYAENYNLIPMYVVDGINDSGLCISINSLPQGEDANFDGTVNYYTTGTNPSSEFDLCALMLSRILLDKCSTINECISELNNWNVWCPCVDPWKSEFSWTITDATGRTIYLEIINNEFKITEGTIDSNNGHLSTNFYQWKWNKNTNNIIIQNSSDSNPINTTLTPHSRGLERYKLINDNIGYNNSISYIFDKLSIANYTNVYIMQSPYRWYSDYCKNWGDPYGDLTINSSVEDFNTIWNYGKSQYDIQNISLVRLGTTMYTNHSIVYDIEDKMMYIKCQEFNKIMEFKL